MSALVNIIMKATTTSLQWIPSTQRKRHLSTQIQQGFNSQAEILTHQVSYLNQYSDSKLLTRTWKVQQDIQFRSDLVRSQDGQLRHVHKQ